MSEARKATLALIAIIDDDEAVRLSTCSLLGDAGFEVRMFKSGSDFLDDAGSDSASCILLDLQMPGMDGLEVLRTLRDRGKTTPVVVMTGHADIAVAVEAMKLGALDFMEKPYAPDDLVFAITRAMAAATAGVRARTVRGDAVALVQTLSERQRQVLQGIAQGLQNKIIAHQLGLSIRTIEAYRAQLMVKLGVRGTAEAVRVALAAGLTLAGSLILDLFQPFAAAGRELLDVLPLGADLEQLAFLTAL